MRFRIAGCKKLWSIKGIRIFVKKIVQDMEILGTKNQRIIKGDSLDILSNEIRDNFC
jgi:hypothetical protein